jgi:hypothetical protein
MNQNVNDPEWTRISAEYTERLKRHIESVQVAGRKLGVPEDQLEAHDLSKYSEEEFPAYAMHFCGGGAPVEFAKAWLHHIHHNPHHWNHWLFADGYSPKDSNVENGRVEMPQHYAIEMVADWMGASFAYTGSWDMAMWLSKNTPRIKLHSKTIYYVTGVLDSMGYMDYVGFPHCGD